MKTFQQQHTKCVEDVRKDDSMCLKTAKNLADIINKKYNIPLRGLVLICMVKFSRKRAAIAY